jgi:vacuolar-type H+-ATPase subunit C/Vma6
MRRKSRLDYAYAVGRVRALEGYLVSRAVFREAVDETDFASAIKVVFDAGRFPEELIDIQNSEELDAFLGKEEKALREELDALVFEKELLDLVSDRHRPDKTLSMANSAGYPYFIDYVKHKIDLGNLKLLLRIKYAGAAGDTFKSQMMTGGFLDKAMLLKNFELSHAEIGESLHASPYRKLWNVAVDKLKVQESFVALERAIEDFLMAHIRKARWIVFGPEPVLAFGFAKMRELANIRILGVGKLNRIPSDILDERMGDTYV